MNATTRTTNRTTQTTVNQGGIKLRIFNSFEDVYPMRDAWDSAVERTGSDIFLSFDWCRIWWKYYGDGRKLELLLFERQNGIVGIIPLYMDRIRMGPLRVRVWKIVGCDCTLNTFCPPIEEDCICEIARKCSSYFEDKSTWDMIFIGPISGVFAHTDALINAFNVEKTRSTKIDSLVSGTQSVLHLQSGWDEYYNSLGHYTRRGIRKTYNLLQKEELDVRTCYAAKDSFEQVFRKFVGMHQKKWENDNRAGFFRSWPHATEFHHELAKTQMERGRLRLMEIHSGKRAIGIDYSYRMGQVQSDLLYARPVDLGIKGVASGKIIWCEVVKKALADNVRLIDHMRGKYEYKKQLGATYFPIRNIYLTSSRMCRQIRIRLFLFVSYCINLAYARLWRNKIAPFLSLNRNEFWSLWIRTHWFGERMK